MFTSIKELLRNFCYVTGDREAHMLFDIDADPYETSNVDGTNPEMVKHMISIIEEYKRGALNAWM